MLFFYIQIFIPIAFLKFLFFDQLVITTSGMIISRGSAIPRWKMRVPLLTNFDFFSPMIHVQQY